MNQQFSLFNARISAVYTRTIKISQAAVSDLASLIVNRDFTTSAFNAYTRKTEDSKCAEYFGIEATRYREALDYIKRDTRLIFMI